MATAKDAREALAQMAECSRDASKQAAVLDKVKLKVFGLCVCVCFFPLFRLGSKTYSKCMNVFSIPAP